MRTIFKATILLFIILSFQETKAQNLTNLEGAWGTTDERLWNSIEDYTECLDDYHEFHIREDSMLTYNQWDDSLSYVGRLHIISDSIITISPDENSLIDTTTELHLNFIRPGCVTLSISVGSHIESITLIQLNNQKDYPLSQNILEHLESSYYTTEDIKRFHITIVGLGLTDWQEIKTYTKTADLSELKSIPLQSIPLQSKD